MATGTGRASAFGVADGLTGLIQAGRHLRDQPFDLAALTRLGICGLAGRILRVLEAFERVVEGQAVVPFVDRLTRPGQRIHRRFVFLRRVAFRTGGTGRVDGALRLIHFLVRGLAARGQEQSKAHTGRCQPATHSL